MMIEVKSGFNPFVSENCLGGDELTTTTNGGRQMMSEKYTNWLHLEYLILFTNASKPM